VILHRVAAELLVQCVESQPSAVVAVTVVYISGISYAYADL